MIRPKLRNGDIVVTGMAGFVPGVVPVGVGQGLLFLTRRWWRMARSWRSWWHFRHVAMVVDDGANLCQAMPGGVEVIPFPEHLLTEAGTLFIRPEYAAGARAGDVWVGGSQADFAATAAKFYEGTPYGFLTYAKLAAGILRMPSTEAWLRRLISTRRDMICSQHVDQALADAGYHVFSDGRLPQDVVPAELATALLQRRGWHAHSGPDGAGWVWNASGRKI